MALASARFKYRQENMNSWVYSEQRVYKHLSLSWRSWFTLLLQISRLPLLLHYFINPSSLAVSGTQSPLKGNACWAKYLVFHRMISKILLFYLNLIAGYFYLFSSECCSDTNSPHCWRFNDISRHRFSWIEINASLRGTSGACEIIFSCQWRFSSR